MRPLPHRSNVFARGGLVVAQLWDEDLVWVAANDEMDLSPFEDAVAGGNADWRRWSWAAESV